MKLRHDGFILMESLTAFSISLLIILTLSYCVNEQFKLLNHWEEQVNADKIILLHINARKSYTEEKFIPNPLMIKNKKYYFSQKNESYSVSVNGHNYEF